MVGIMITLSATYAFFMIFWKNWDIFGCSTSCLYLFDLKLGRKLLDIMLMVLIYVLWEAFQNLLSSSPPCLLLWIFYFNSIVWNIHFQKNLIIPIDSRVILHLNKYIFYEQWLKLSCYYLLHTCFIPLCWKNDLFSSCRSCSFYLCDLKIGRI